MKQLLSKTHTFFSIPIIYTWFQKRMGAKLIRDEFVNDFIRPVENCTILDLGCGPADILSHLPQVDYWGIDSSQAYIRQAKKFYGSRGTFKCQSLDAKSLLELPKFDIIMCLGVLHHLDDALARNILAIASDKLNMGGRFVSFDPCFFAGQSLVARSLALLDRGKYVRSSDQYEALVVPSFKSVYGEIRRQKWPPYSRFFMECSNI